MVVRSGTPRSASPLGAPVRPGRAPRRRRPRARIGGRTARRSTPADITAFRHQYARQEQAEHRRQFVGERVGCLVPRRQQGRRPLAATPRARRRHPAPSGWPARRRQPITVSTTSATAANASSVARRRRLQRRWRPRLHRRSPARPGEDVFQPDHRRQVIIAGFRARCRARPARRWSRRPARAIRVAAERTQWRASAGR